MDRQSCLQSLFNSQLLSATQLTVLSDRPSQNCSQDLLSDLVQEEVLTPFQARRVQEGELQGLVLGRYRILDELGRGGYGCVYKARHEIMNRVVALKVISPDLVGDERVRAWFRREVLAATQLHHPNIAIAFDADEIDGNLFFAMEYVDGPTLDGLVRETGPLAISLAADMLYQAAKALQFAHEHGMVHRDLKPANLLIPRAAVAAVLNNPSLRPQPALVKIVDFGLARLGKDSTGQTLNLRNERGFVGTPDFVSPEQARNVHQVDIRSDLYSLGCTFYFALTGRRPFRAGTPLEVIVQHLESDPEPIDTIRPEIPAPLASIIRRLMAKKPERRFQTPADLLAELSFFFGTGDAVIVTGSGELPRPSGLLAIRRGACVASPTRPKTWTGEEAMEEPHWPAATMQLPEMTPPEQAGVEAATELPTTSHREQLTRDEASLASALGVADAALRHAWSRWTGVLTHLLVSSRWTLSEAEYGELHATLLQACRTHAERTHGATQAIFRHLEDVVQPWLSPQAVVAMDRATLTDLVERCQGIGEHLALPQPGVPAWVGAVAGVTGSGLLVWLLTQAQDNSMTLNGSFARSLWHALQDHPVLALAVVLPLMAFAAMTLFGRLLRA